MNRRVSILVDRLSRLIPETQPLQGLDVGCGSGEVAYWLTQKRSNISLQGVDVLVRSQTHIPVQQFDGLTLPFADNSVDFIMLVDVLHHTEKPDRLLAECTRVSRQFILIKDHYCNGWWDDLRLRFMDWVGNRSYGVALPYNYQSTSQWQDLFSREKLVTEQTLTQLHLYPRPASYIFDSNLHFISRLQK